MNLKRGYQNNRIVEWPLVSRHAREHCVRRYRKRTRSAEHDKATRYYMHGCVRVKKTSISAKRPTMWRHIYIQCPCHYSFSPRSLTVSIESFDFTACHVTARDMRVHALIAKHHQDYLGEVLFNNTNSLTQKYDSPIASSLSECGKSNNR